MKLVADTNWLIATYFADVKQPRTQIVDRFAERCDAPWFVPLPALIEARNIFALLARISNSQQWKVLQSHIGTRIFIPDVSWQEIQSKTEELCDRFSSKAAIGTVDLMIIATALKLEATHFLSF